MAIHWRNVPWRRPDGRWAHFEVIVGLACGLFATPGRSVQAQPVFTEVTSSAGIDFVHTHPTEPYSHNKNFTPGVAVGDYDGDGDPDIYFCNGYSFANELYRNDGDGTFTEVAPSVLRLTLEESKCAMFFDYDGDGDLDLLVANDGKPVSQNPTEVQHRLFENLGGGSFLDVTDAVQFPAHPYSEAFGDGYTVVGGLQAGDVNNDGYLDVYVSYWQDYDTLIINNAGETFTDVSDEAGIAIFDKDSWSSQMYDFNRDGWLDIHVNVDYTEDLLFINQGLNVNDNPTFVDIATEAGIDSRMSEMGGSFVDFDNDGDLDMYFTNIERPSTIVGDDSKEPDEWNRFWRNDTVGSTPQFTDMLDELGGVCRTGWGWGNTFFDYDHNGWADVAVVNGSPGGADVFQTDPSEMFRNDGGVFTSISDEVGFNDTRIARGLLSFDYDLDGDRDLLVTNFEDVPLLYRNDGGNIAGNWFVVDLSGSSPNTRGIGATVHITAGGLNQMRYLGCTTSFVSQEPDEAHFGVASAATVDLVRVEWANGTVDVLSNQAVNQRITVIEGAHPVVGAVIALKIAGPGSIASAEAVNFTLTADYDDSTSEDVTAQAVWSVEPEVAGTFPSPGAFVATAVGPGESLSATVKATFELLQTTQALEIVDDSTIDIAEPILALTSPTTLSVTTDVPTFTLTGTSQDNFGVTSVVWSTDGGDSGPCFGVAQWSTPPISLDEGVNEITVTAGDAARNSSSLTVTVTYTPPPPVNDNTEPNVNANANENQDNDNEVDPATNANTGPPVNTNANPPAANENDNDFAPPPPSNDNEAPVQNANDNVVQEPGPRPISSGGSSAPACGAFGMITLYGSLFGLYLMRRRGHVRIDADLDGRS